MDIQVLRNFSLFATLSDQDLQTFVNELQELSLAPGEVLMAEGARTERVYLVVEGELAVIKSMGPGEERLLGVRSAGAMLGEMSIFNEALVHTATVRASTPARVLWMTPLQFDWLLHKYPEVAYGMLRILSRRLQATDELAVADLRQKNRELTLAYQELQAAQAELIEKEKIEHELQLAADIQRSVLPAKVPAHPQFDFGALMIPARAVGGDFYDFIALSKDLVGIVVGDVCDKGVPAAMYMGLVYSAVRMASSPRRSPGDTLRAVNQHLLQIGRSNMYATLLYGILDLLTGTFSYARAGHPWPLLLDQESQPVQTPRGRGQPIGLFAPVAVDEQAITIPEGGTLLLYSDGLSETVEARQDPIELGVLCSTLIGRGPVSAQAVCQRLWEAAGSGEAGNPPIADDFTLITIRRLVSPGG